MTESILQARGMDAEVHRRIVRAARVRGWTVARYLEAMVKLVDEMRATVYIPQVWEFLDRHGLTYVQET